MVEKGITKKYLGERTTFKDKTVVGALDFNDLWSIVKQLNPSEQKSIFKVVDREIRPLSENQIDSLLIYLPTEIKDGLDFIDMTKADKLKLVRENKENLVKVIEKKNYSESIDLDRKEVIPNEEYSSAKLWEIVKARASLT